MNERALCLLTGYLLTRLKLTDADIGEAIQTSRGGGRFRFVRNFMRGRYSLSAFQSERLRAFLFTQLKKIPRDIFANDRHFVQPLIDALIENPTPNPKELDQTIHDTHFLHSFGINADDPKFAEKSRELHDLVGGFWFLIRFSTREETTQNDDPYRLSLLSVHDLRYMHVVEPRGQVRTIIPHFTIRASVASSGMQQKTEGRVLRANDAEICFFGSRVSLGQKMLTRITLQTPQKRDRFAISNASPPRLTYGVLMTPIFTGQTIAGPIIAIEVPHREAFLKMRAKIAEAERDLSNELAEAYAGEREKLEPLIGYYDDDDLVAEVGRFTDKSLVLEGIEHLQAVRKLVAEKPELRGGNYFVGAMPTQSRQSKKKRAPL